LKTLGVTVVLRPGLVFAFLAIALWFAFAVFVPPSALFELLTALLLPLGGMALWRWGPGAVRNLFARLPTPAKILTIAVATMAFSASFQSIFRLVYLWLGKPTRMTSEFSIWISFPTYALDIALILYLLSTRRETDPPMPLLMWVVGIGALAVLGMGFAVRLFMVGTLIGG